MHTDLCGGKPGLCEAMRPASGATLLRYLRQVRFTGSKIVISLNSESVIQWFINI